MLAFVSAPHKIQGLPAPQHLDDVTVDAVAIRVPCLSRTVSAGRPGALPSDSGAQHAVPKTFHASRQRNDTHPIRVKRPADPDASIVWTDCVSLGQGGPGRGVRLLLRAVFGRTEQPGGSGVAVAGRAGGVRGGKRLGVRPDPREGGQGVVERLGGRGRGDGGAQVGV